MTCPCEDMKILWRQHDSDGLLNGIWPAQRLRGLGIFQGIQGLGVWVHPRPLPAHTLAVCGSPAPSSIPCTNPSSSISHKPRRASGLLLLEQTHSRCLFCACAFIVTAREEDSTETLSVFLPPCALLGFHHQPATLRLFMGFRLIYCPFFSLCNAPQEPPEATSDPAEDKIHRPETCLVVTDVRCGQGRSVQHFPMSSPPLELISTIPRFFRAPWRNLGLAFGGSGSSGCTSCPTA